MINVSDISLCICFVGLQAIISCGVVVRSDTIFSFIVYFLGSLFSFMCVLWFNAVVLQLIVPSSTLADYMINGRWFFSVR